MNALKKGVICVVALFLIYVVCYVVIRSSHKQVSDADGKAYVVFPASGKVLYYLFRPISAVDGSLTGTQSRIDTPEETP